MALLLKWLTSADPQKDIANAAKAIHPTSFQLIDTRFEYWYNATDVPEKAGIFEVPKSVATGKFGKVIRRTGVCIKPPPPTMASIKPAQKAAIQTISVLVIKKIKIELF